MKDLGLLSYFLGLEISHDSSGYFLTQAKYTSDLLARTGLTDCKTAPTPVDPQTCLTPLDDHLLSDATLYYQLVGSLVYLTVTRPDIAYAVHIVSQFTVAPRSLHYNALIRILRYLKGTILGRGSYWLSFYYRICFFLGDSLIAWRSKKQTLVARSSTEDEYRALVDTTQELLWLHWLLTDMGVFFPWCHLSLL
ncbi:uncharacterized protein LOC114278420 [Camellia sinensis]|uniref:uncharacterized protein LOC114278420 n=1 Tax=Camellia sinensis TaxID=4442 RepID=UPI0010358E18|nr:uncharacterized protein LOC114278420 [Camellia sinensis]